MVPRWLGGTSGGSAADARVLNTPEEAVEVFDELCAGRHVIWDGVVTRSTSDSVMIKMKPGRTRVRYDLVLKLAEEPDQLLFRGRRKLRFRGVVEARGDVSHADHFRNLASPHWQKVVPKILPSQVAYRGN